jgi:hypothetical protein
MFITIGLMPVKVPIDFFSVLLSAVAVAALVRLL